MRKLSARRKKVVALSGVVASMGSAGIVAGRHHPWAFCAVIGVQVVVLVYILQQIMVLKREDCDVKLGLDE